MPKIFLTPYHISITPLGKPKEKLSFDPFTSNLSLLTVLADIIQGGLVAAPQVGSDTVFQVTKLDLDNVNARIINGRFSGGDYGYTAKRIKVGNLEHLGDREIDHSELVEYYFHVYLPEGGKKGLIFTQSLGEKSFGNKLKLMLETGVKTLHSQHRLRIDRVIENEALDEYIKFMSSITLMKHGVPSNIESTFISDGRTNKEFVTKTTLSHTRVGKTWPTNIVEDLRQFARSRSRDSLASLATLSGYEPDTINIESEVKGRRVVINIADPSVNARYDVTGDTRDPSTGGADFSKIQEFCTDLHNKLL